MKHNVVDMDLLSKDVSDMIQSLDIPDVFRITERESLTSPSIPPSPRSGCSWSSLWTEMSWLGRDLETSVTRD